MPPKSKPQTPRSAISTRSKTLEKPKPKPRPRTFKPGAELIEQIQ